MAHNAQKIDISNRLSPSLKLVKIVKSLLFGILNAIRHNNDNADAKCMNTKIQKIKDLACGFRNDDQFANAIYFHLGRLDLYPALPTL